MRRAAKRPTPARPEVRGASPARALQATAGLLGALTFAVLAATAWPRLAAHRTAAVQPQESAAVAASVPAIASPSAPADAVPPATPADAAPAAPAAPSAAATAPLPTFSFTSRDGSITFTVPRPGDPDYADYQEMLRHPHFRSSLDGLPGYALPYDPEWRAAVIGKRQVGPTPLQLQSDAGSLEALASAYLRALGASDEVALLRLRVSREEWEGILWPEFPQSRPYVRIRPEDAWMLHHATSMSGAQKGLESFGGHQLELVEVTHGETVAYTNFTLIQGVVIRARDQKTQQFVEIPYLSAVVGRNGRFKAYIYEG